MKLWSLVAAMACALFAPAAALSQPVDAPYGSAKFAAYSDIDNVKQLRMVWDFNFVDPTAVRFAFNNLAALLRATAE